MTTTTKTMSVEDIQRYLRNKDASHKLWWSVLRAAASVAAAVAAVVSAGIFYHT